MKIEIKTGHYQGWINKPEQSRELAQDLEATLAGTKNGLAFSAQFSKRSLSFVLSARPVSGSGRLTATLKKDWGVKTSSLSIIVSADNLPMTPNPLDYLSKLFNLPQVYAIANDCYGSGDD